MRGSDINYNPVFFSYLVLHQEESDTFKLDLFVNPDKVSDKEVSAYLESNNISVHPYEAITDDYFQKLSKRPIAVDKDSCNYLLVNTLDQLGFDVKHAKNLVPLLKCRKNKVQ